MFCGVQVRHFSELTRDRRKKKIKKKKANGGSIVACMHADKVKYLSGVRFMSKSVLACPLELAWRPRSLAAAKQSKKKKIVKQTARLVMRCRTTYHHLLSFFVGRGMMHLLLLLFYIYILKKGTVSLIYTHTHPSQETKKQKRGGEKEKHPKHNSWSEDTD